jgi:hypothetical protein
MKLATEKASPRAARYDAAVVRGGFRALQTVALEASQRVGLRPQLVAGFGRIHIFSEKLQRPRDSRLFSYFPSVFQMLSSS